jgi:hypothetical protein
MQTPSPTGALGAPSFYALGWRRMGKETDSLRVRYLDKVRKMREKRNKKLGGVRKPTSTLKPKAAPATPMDTAPSESPTSEYTVAEQILLDHFRVTPETFSPTARKEWEALWPQSLGPGLEEAERAMRSFHQPNGDIKLYVPMSKNPDASDETIQVQLWVNTCYLMCKSDMENYATTWAEMEAAYAEYLQKVATAAQAAPDEAMAVEDVASTAARGDDTLLGELPLGPQWHGEEAAKEATIKTCVYALRGLAVGAGMTYLTAQGAAALVAAGVLGPGLLASTVAAVGVTVAGGLAPVATKAITDVVVKATANLSARYGLSDPVTGAGALVGSVQGVFWGTINRDLVGYNLVYQKLAEKQKLDLVTWLMGLSPEGQRALSPEQILFNQRALLNGKTLAEMPSTMGFQLKTDKAVLDNIDTKAVAKLFRKHHVVAPAPEVAMSTLLSSGQDAVINQMDMVTDLNDAYWCQEIRTSFVRWAAKLKSGVKDAAYYAKWYGPKVAGALAGGFAQQRWAKQKMTADYLKGMLIDPQKLPREKAEAQKAFVNATEQRKIEHDLMRLYENQGRPMQQINDQRLHYYRAERTQRALKAKLDTMKKDPKTRIEAARMWIEMQLCTIADAHILAYIMRGQPPNNPPNGIVRAHTLQGMERLRGTPPLARTKHAASEYKRAARFNSYTTRTPEEERRTILYYFKTMETDLWNIFNQLVPVSNRKRDYSEIDGWLGMNPRAPARGLLKTFYDQIDIFNNEKQRLIDNRLLTLGPGETEDQLWADSDAAEGIKRSRPCNGTAAAPNGAVSVVDAAFARLAV